MKNFLSWMIGNGLLILAGGIGLNSREGQNLAISVLMAAAGMLIISRYWKFDK